MTIPDLPPDSPLRELFQHFLGEDGGAQMTINAFVDTINAFVDTINAASSASSNPSLTWLQPAELNHRT
jgi:hypothetical protein